MDIFSNDLFEYYSKTRADYDSSATQSILLSHEREHDEPRYSFEEERRLYSFIAQGKPAQLRAAFLGELQARRGVQNIILSPDSIRQTRYIAVVGIAISCRVAMMNGVPEQLSYAYSDAAIRHIDGLDSVPDIMDHLILVLTHYAEQVAHYKTQAGFSARVREAIRYIHTHLHSKIPLSDIAHGSGCSKEYLAILFKKETGQTITSYIAQQRVEEAKSLMSSGLDYEQIAYLLGYCSQSHFIAAFRRVEGITPAQYARAGSYIP